MDADKLIGRNLKRLRKQAKFSQTRLGNAAGIGQTTVSAIEMHKVAPQIDTLQDIARALKVPVWELLIPPDASDLLRSYQAASPDDRAYLLRFAASLNQRASE